MLVTRSRLDPPIRASDRAAAQPGSGSKNGRGSTGSSSVGSSGSASSAAWFAGCTGATNRPSSGTSSDEHPSPRAARIGAKAFDNAGVQRLAEDYVIDGLRFAGPNEAGAVTIRDPDGAPIGQLTWPARRLGDVAHARISPLVFVMLFLIVVTVLILMAIAARGFRRIRESEQWRGLPVIMLTAVRAPADQEGAQKLGAVAVMQKPFMIGEVVDEVRKHAPLSAESGGKAG